MAIETVLKEQKENRYILIEYYKAIARHYYL